MTSSRTLQLPGRRRGRLALWLVVGLSVLLFLISPLIQLLAEWPWFSALGYERVFATRLIASLLLGIVAGGAAFALLYANLRFAQRGIVPNPRCAKRRFAYSNANAAP